MAKEPAGKKEGTLKIFGYEDMIVGILLGIVMIGVSGKYTLPYQDKLFIGLLILFLIVAVIDIIYELKTIKEDFIFSILAVIWNIGEIVIVVAYLLEIFALPFQILQIIPFIGMVGIFGVGIFFILGNIMWLVLYFRE